MFITEILHFLDTENQVYTYHGDPLLPVSGFCSLKNIKPGSVVWIKDTGEYDLHALDPSLNLLIVTNITGDADIKEYNIIACPNPRFVFFGILSHFFQEPVTPEIASTAVVKTDKIGLGVSIGHHCYIGPEAVIGDFVVIKNHVTIECKAVIGDHTIIHSGVVIGADGFGYDKKDGVNIKVPHFGGVRIGKDVEIGANACIDRGTIDDTVIGDNVKIDNLSHIAHNACIQENVLVNALCTIAGSCVLEKKSYIAPGASIMNQTVIGENSVIGMGAIVTQDVAPDKVVVATSARTIRDNTGNNKGI